MEFSHCEQEEDGKKVLHWILLLRFVCVGNLLH